VALPPLPPQLLVESRQIVEDANWGQLRLLLSRVLDTPNDAKANMFNCVAFIDNARTAQQADDMVSPPPRPPANPPAGAAQAAAARVAGRRGRSCSGRELRRACGQAGGGTRWAVQRPAAGSTPSCASAAAALPPPLLQVGEFLDFIDSMDYNKYFDSMSNKAPTGTQQAEFVKFSLQAAKAAELKLGSFLSLLPAADVAAARQQVQAELDLLE
jgi:hypothetical protein